MHFVMARACHVGAAPRIPQGQLNEVWNSFVTSTNDVEDNFSCFVQCNKGRSGQVVVASLVTQTWPWHSELSVPMGGSYLRTWSTPSWRC